ncbi:MAG: ExbD/TolR family protein [Phycisphaeraceae bacterium]
MSDETRRNPDRTTPTVHHRTARQRRGRPAANMALNLTAMIDVIFLLLVYFVITANFGAGEGVLTAKLPEPSEGDAAENLAPPRLPLEVHLLPSAEGVRIRIGSARPVEGFAELGPLLEQMQRDPDEPEAEGMFAPDDPVIIRSDPRVRWQHVVNAFNAARAAGYTSVRIDRAEAPAGEGGPL